MRNDFRRLTGRRRRVRERNSAWRIDWLAIFVHRYGHEDGLSGLCSVPERTAWTFAERS